MATPRTTFLGSLAQNDDRLEAQLTVHVEQTLDNTHVVNLTMSSDDGSGFGEAMFDLTPSQARELSARLLEGAQMAEERNSS